MSISSNTALTLTPGQGSIKTDALTPGVGGDAKPKSRGCNHESSKADNFKPPPLKRQPSSLETKAVGVKRPLPRALTAGGTSYGLMSHRSQIRSEQAKVAAVIAWPEPKATKAPEALKRRKLRPVVTHDSPVPSGGFGMFDPHDEGEAAAREQALHDQAVRDQAAEDQAAEARAIARRNARELREQSARERAARDYESPSEEGSCQPPKRPVKYGGFPSGRAKQDFHGNAMSMSPAASDAFFSALLDAKSKAEKHFDNANLMVMADYEQFGSLFCDLSPEQKNARDVLEETRAMAKQSLQAIQAKIDAMSKIGVMST